MEAATTMVATVVPQSPVITVDDCFNSVSGFRTRYEDYWNQGKLICTSSDRETRSSGGKFSSCGYAPAS